MTSSTSISGKGIQNRSFGSMPEKEGETGEESGEPHGIDRELSGRSKITANAFASLDKAASLNGPKPLFSESEQDWTGSESDMDSKLFLKSGKRWTSSELDTDSKFMSEFSLVADVSVRARVSLQPVGIGISTELPDTLTTWPVGNKTEIERFKSILAERLMLKEEDAAILTLEEKKVLENSKILCSNSKT